MGIISRALLLLASPLTIALSVSSIVTLLLGKNMSESEMQIWPQFSRTSPSSLWCLQKTRRLRTLEAEMDR